LVPTPTPVKPPAPPTTPREPGSQQGVRAAEGAGGAKESRREEGPTPKEARINRTKSLDGRPVRGEMEELGATR
jgi:hypothetical protein